MLLTVTTLSLAAIAVADDGLPDRTQDGLVRIESKNVSAVYWQEGATLAPYTKVKLVECSVAFRKNWMRDQNSSAATDLSGRVHADDMERIKNNLSVEFNKIFTQVLEDGGYEVVEEYGEDVMTIRPAIVNLDVSVPNTRSASTTRTYAASAGQMTLYMELYDSATGAKIGLVLDARSSRDQGYVSSSTSAANRNEADRILTKWSELLVKALDAAKEETK